MPVIIPIGRFLMTDSVRIWAVLAAAGEGRRLGGARKQYRELAGKSVLQHSLEALCRPAAVAGVVVGVAADAPDLPPECLGKQVKAVPGGETRQATVLACVRRLRDEDQADYALVHDAARPCVGEAEIERLLAAGLQPDGALLALGVVDSLKQAGTGTPPRLEQTLNRERHYLALTPQLFPLPALAAALEQAQSKGVAVDDEAHAMELAGLSPQLVEGDPANLKLTYAGQWPLLEAWLTRR